MKALKFKNPTIVLDLETTGTWVEKDRIVEIAMIRRERLTGHLP
jgi:DNA polymerase III epsilon subunit-like protein